MADTSADILIDTLHDWGVEVIFGLPGDGISGIMEALRTRQDQVRFIQVRHEEAAAFMACAYAKYTGKLGACLATSGPGGIHLLNGLYDAKLDGVPVVGIAGLQHHDLIGTHTQQDVDLMKLYTDVSVYTERVMGPAHVENVVDMACRTALSRRSVATLVVPVDVQTMKSEKRSKRNVPHHERPYCTTRAGLPHEDDLARAADVLNRGKRVALLVGRGALHATDELEQAAELLGAPIIKALLGKAAVPDDSPYTVGGIGLLGTKPAQEAIASCDTLLLVGTSFPYLEFYPKPGDARCVQIDLDPERLGLRYPVDVGLVGDSKLSLQRLLPLLERHEDRRFLERAQSGMADWWGVMEERATNMAWPMRPQVVAWELGKRLRDNAIVSCDSGTAATWFARQIKARRGQMYSLSGTLAAMANGLPYTIAAQIAYPRRQCVAFVGDGALAMLMAELATAVKYKLPIKVVVLKNDTLGQIKWEQMVRLGNPEFGCELQPIDFTGIARACGASAFHLEDPHQCGQVLDVALETPGPVVVEAVVDPLMPPLPAKITTEQAAKFAESRARGEPNAMKIATIAGKAKVRELI
ncbi:MAG TPA: thiamine pyrophosphate-dependent enzyme [Polyangia bacterium]